MQVALARHDARAACRRRTPRLDREDDRRRHVRHLRRPALRDRGALAFQHGGRRVAHDRRSRGPLRYSRRCGPAARQRLLRQYRKPCRANHGRRARRTGAAVAGGRRSACATGCPIPCRCATSASCGCATSRARSVCTSCCILHCAETSPPCARWSHPEQPAAAGNVLRRPRARTRRGDEGADRNAAVHARRRRRHRQDSPVAATCRRRLDDYPDGVWFVELAPIADPRLVTHVVADAGRHGGRRASLAERSSPSCDKRSLVVLDNCEHLVDACAALPTGCCATRRGEADSVESRAVAHRR